MVNLKKVFLVIVILGLMMIWIPQFALAGWPGDPKVNVPISIGSGERALARIASDGSGGAIIAWRDSRNGNFDIYAQRVDVNGAVKWTTNGAPIATGSGNQFEHQLISDGSGGAIITWMESVFGYYCIYAKRVDANGSTRWTNVMYCRYTQYHDGYDPQLVSDGSGGAIITWYDNDNDNYDIRAQRVDANGSKRWTKYICTDSGDQRDHEITSDGSGGAIIVWRDYRNNGSSLYAQRVDVNGGVRWSTNGVPISTISPTDQQITSDGSGGAVIVWKNYSNSSNHDIYAQRVNASGGRLWTTNGVPICTASDHQVYPRLTSDGSGGAIITWGDRRNGADYDIYAQHVASDGSANWTANGMPISIASGNQQYSQLMSDGSGGAIITWAGGGVYAQWVASDGSFNWTADGVLVSTRGGGAPQLVSDDSGGAIIAFQGSIYAQRVYSHGSIALMSSISPDTGSIYVGTEVTIGGGSFGSAQGTVTFDGQAASITSWSDAEIVCVAPLHAPGAVDVVLTRDDGYNYTEPAGFTYIGTTIRSIFADTGSIYGGTSVTIGGVSFDTTQGTGGVTFDGQAATITSWSDGEIVCVTPAHAPGVVDVVVTTNANDSYTEPAGFTYIGMSVFCLTPSEGLPAGGTQVTIDGLEFGSERGTGSVTFGGQAATIVSWSDDKIVCTTPPHAAGVVNVVVTNDGGDSDTASFIYAKMVTSITPDTGPAAGGTDVTIGGIEFGDEQGSGSVTFGGQAAAIVNWSDTEIVCQTPPHAAGLVEVVVTNGDGISDTSAFTYTGQTPDGTLKWKFFTGADMNKPPAIGPDGTIYTGKYGNDFYALNPDGTQKWKFTAGSTVGYSAIGSDGTIYVGSNDKNLYALNPDGTQKWAFTAGGGCVHPPCYRL